MKRILLFFLFSIGSVLGTENFRLIYPDFDQSLARHGRSYFHYERYYNYIDLKAPPLYYLVKETYQRLYDRDKRRSMQDCGIYKIPRIIHQIWLGSPFPEKYRNFSETWQKWEGWEYKLWTDKEVEEFPLHNTELYHKADNYGEKSDILRYEILYAHGGLYVDTDMICTAPDFFEFAVQNYNFFLGLEPLECAPFSCGNALMACSPGHPMMGLIITGMQDHISSIDSTWTVETTGPRYVTKQIYEHIDLLEEEGIIFPTTFFYPILGDEFSRLRLLRRHETAAIHCFHGSWWVPQSIQ